MIVLKITLVMIIITKIEMPGEKMNGFLLKKGDRP